MALYKAIAWLMHPKHRQKALETGRQVKHLFTYHPEQTEETYLQHLMFTLGMGLRFLYIGTVIIIHGLFPFLLVRTASNQVIKAYRIMRGRVPKSQVMAAEEQEYQYHGA